MRIEKLDLRVRYADTDQMGVVYYGNYAQYFEMGRTEWLRKLGFSYRWMEENGIMLPVTELQIKYKRPARYDDLLTVTTSLVRLPTVKIEFDYQIHNQNNELLTTGFTTLVFVDKETGKLRSAPDYLIEKINSES
jgi:acyl-CoA thioester hydrolase